MPFRLSCLCPPAALAEGSDSHTEHVSLGRSGIHALHAQDIPLAAERAPSEEHVPATGAEARSRGVTCSLQAASIANGFKGYLHTDIYTYIHTYKHIYCSYRHI